MWKTKFKVIKQNLWMSPFLCVCVYVHAYTYVYNHTYALISYIKSGRTDIKVLIVRSAQAPALEELWTVPPKGGS